MDGKVLKMISVNIPKIHVRNDLITRAFLAERSKKRQPYGTNKLAGKRTSAHYHGRRHRRWSMMNREMARMKRIHNQGFLNFTARFVPQAVKGRKAHPPKVEKKWKLKVNKKEHLKAIIHAAIASFNYNIVKNRHKIDDVNIPIVFCDEIENIGKTKKLINILKNIKMDEELKRIKEKKIRAGKGKTRGRRYKKKKGALFVVINKEKIEKAVRNISGFDVENVDNLCVEILAPGAHPGRLIIWSESSLRKFEEKVKEVIA